MTLKMLIDMNLSPAWVAVLTKAGVGAVHWSSIGDPRSTDRTILAWAREHGYVVLTQDLDFAMLLALTYANGPSVVLIRGQDIISDSLADLVVTACHRHADDLTDGALVTVEEGRSRVRVLPIRGARTPDEDAG